MKKGGHFSHRQKGKSLLKRRLKNTLTKKKGHSVSVSRILFEYKGNGFER
jgi:hypothetical protein